MTDLHALFVNLPVLTFDDGDIVLGEGKKAPGMYFLKSGKVSFYRGSELVSEQAEVGTAVGDVAVLLECPSLATARAVGATCFYFVEDAEAFLLTQPAIAVHVSRGLAKKLHFIGAYLTDVKQQYAGTGNHLSMVNDVLDSFINSKKH